MLRDSAVCSSRPLPKMSCYKQLTFSWALTAFSQPVVYKSSPTLKPQVVMHTCNPSISEVDVGRTDIRGYLLTHRESEAGLSYKSLASKNQNITITQGDGAD